MEIELKHEKYKLKDLWTGLKIQFKVIAPSKNIVKLILIAGGCIFYLYFLSRKLAYYLFIVYVIAIIITLLTYCLAAYNMILQTKITTIFLSEDEIILKKYNMIKVLSLKNTKMFTENNSFIFLDKMGNSLRTEKNISYEVYSVYIPKLEPDSANYVKHIIEKYNVQPYNK